MMSSQDDMQDATIEKYGLHRTPYEAFIIEKVGLDSCLKEAWFAEVNGEKVDTLEFIRKGVTEPSIQVSTSTGGDILSNVAMVIE